MKKKLSTAILIDNNQIKEWQKASLENIRDLINIKIILNCKNNKTLKKPITNFFYYLLNIFTLRNKLTKNREYLEEKAAWTDFYALQDGHWQCLPDKIVNKIKSNKIDLIIKFGMGLLDVNGSKLNTPVFSFHHGDPSKYRGRPPSFYEILNKEKNVGTVIQKLNNKIDSGEIVAISYSKIDHYSYKKTLLNLFNNSQYLLRKAVINFINKNDLKISGNGKLYKLPSNFLVIKFIFILFYRKIRRYYYGIFIEKKWNFVVFNYQNLKSNQILDKLNKSNKIYEKFGKSPEIINPYIFYADPFYSSDGKHIYAEALNKKNGLGEIAKFSATKLSLKDIILKGSGHFAYPQCLDYNNQQWILPEISAHSKQKIFNISNDSIINLDVEDQPLLIDATIFNYKNKFYLFCGKQNNCLDNLFLYVSDKLVGPYYKHPCNPIVSNPINARMAGNILNKDGKLYRFGQDNCFRYGKQIIVSEILEITEQDYREEVIGDIYFFNKDGTHTINFFENNVLMDYYEEKFSFLAGYRRLLGKFNNNY